MKVQLLSALNDTNVDAAQLSNQRQLAISISAIADQLDQSLPLNLCLILDKSGSMHGEAIDTVIQAVEQLLAQLKPGDRISIVAFAGTSEVIIPNQIVSDIDSIKAKLKNKLKASGGTVIAEALSLGITELLKGTKGAVSQAFLLTDGRGDGGLKIWKWEIGPNDHKRCLELAQKATRVNLTINTFGFGNEWNQDLLEKIADAGGGSLAYIERPEQAVDQFGSLFKRIQSVGLTNAHLLLSLVPSVRLAELKPIAQVAPETIELSVETEANGSFIVRLGDLMKDAERVVLTNIYLGQLPEGKQVIGHIQIRYDNPAENKEGLLSPLLPVYANVTKAYQPAVNPQVIQSILVLAKYRQTQVAETKLEQGDRAGAVTMLQTAAKTALQIGDTGAATVLQSNATRLQAGEELSESDRKKTRIVSKTILRE
ncbi:VWA domain-containing protein [Anabaena cylindrica FACHB-243]|uniref:von Willebrand factor type A n=1 Tax=Anabaena cylindrica (strain ATCC 27899 / PCC 7122) TaxID=272123 RepID=K9ZPJ2_ANACC|nr:MULTISPECIES: VWA domain-containing protein [Anabaena]AFZ60689.1 von Willebrand factor type A [Anabaena cylindrica PCC 7122]MBD2419529.1 VWA domain-containing protein [Anabaena cylindrica FACHB-243]MBY5282212.1 VWA domain-containing protein [Anabaena sp. CCAP 1446/1C]MBY5309110.1 VWA domain-containing protein [Anabaena sp. CCAP 1446/1C]MCM2409723.1 VWA domain-containing protein [Anabaena sp. CCAP 1446/1C]